MPHRCMRFLAGSILDRAKTFAVVPPRSSLNAYTSRLYTRCQSIVCQDDYTHYGRQELEDWAPSIRQSEEHHTQNNNTQHGQQELAAWAPLARRSEVHHAQHESDRESQTSYNGPRPPLVVSSSYPSPRYRSTSERPTGTAVSFREQYFIGGSNYRPNRRQRKRPEIFPSEELTEALRQSGRSVLPWSHLHHRKTARSVAVKNQPYSKLPLNFSIILSRYIRRCGGSGLQDKCQPVNTKSEEPCFEAEELVFLRRHGLIEEDVQLWHSILAEPDPDVATLRLHEAKQESHPGIVPPFVLLYLLRRESVSPSAFRLLLNISCSFLDTSVGTRSAEAHRLSGHEDKATSEALSSTLHLDNDAKILLFIRLLRHARIVFPAGIEAIGEIIATHLGRGTWCSANTAPHRSLRHRSVLISKYNTLLRLVALPASLHPMASSAFQERAQLTMLAAMARYDPPLPVTEQGYWAVARVHLARQKTPRDRDWGNLKSSAWPPWKENHTALDEVKDMDYGTSNAGKVIAQMKEAGYPGGIWTRSVCIYSGWDTDDSPTIQTRHLLDGSGIIEKPKWSKSEFSTFQSKSCRHDISMWTARIRATRTVNEAWACFLALEGSGGPLGDAQVYLALAEKIDTYDQQTYRALRRGSKDQPRQMAGDGKEVSTKFHSPNETVYVPKPPPTLADLYGMMNVNKVHIDKEDFAHFAKFAPSLTVLAEGLRTLTRDGEDVLEVLLSPNVEAAVISEIDSHIFEAVCDFLLRRRHTSHVQKASKSAGSMAHHPALSQQYRSIFLVWRLLGQRQTGHAIVWNKLVQALSDSAGNNFEVSGRLGFARRAVETFHLMERTIQDVDKRKVVLLPRSLHRIFALAKRAVEGMEAIRAAASSEHDMEIGFFEHIRQFVNHRFYATVGGSSVDTAENESKTPPYSPDVVIPLLNVAPSPAVLHAFIRTLGSLHDFNGIRELSLWMRRYWPELSCPTVEFSNGWRLLRRTIVAMRVYLEGRHLVRRQDRRRYGKSADVALLREVEDVVNSVPDWEGWPDAAEVDDYVRHDFEQLQYVRSGKSAK